VLRYVPAGYRQSLRDGIGFWFRDEVDVAIVAIVCEARAAVEALLDHRLVRALHVVVYASNEEARRALDREVSASALLAPLHTRASALIAMQSAAADARNGDLLRMRRHICHELAHVFSSERTESEKFLGDGDRGMRMPSWVDEGFAENVSALACAMPEIVAKALARNVAENVSLARMAAAFSDLNSEDRPAAFATATTIVSRAIEKHGLRHVFDHLRSGEAEATLTP
jgi:hypothetical protein